MKVPFNGGNGHKAFSLKSSGASCDGVSDSRTPRTVVQAVRVPSTSSTVIEVGNVRVSVLTVARVKECQRFAQL